jgi:hypothetical protein
MKNLSGLFTFERVLPSILSSINQWLAIINFTFFNFLYIYIYCISNGRPAPKTVNHFLIQHVNEQINFTWSCANVLQFLILFFFCTHELRLGNVLRKCLLAQSWQGSEDITRVTNEVKLCESKWYEAMAHEQKCGAKYDLILLCGIKSDNYFLFPHCLLGKRNISNPLHKMKFMYRIFFSYYWIIKTKWNFGSQSGTKPLHKNIGMGTHNLVLLSEIKSGNYFLFPHFLGKRMKISNPLHKMKFFTVYPIAIIEYQCFHSTDQNGSMITNLGYLPHFKYK